VVYGNKLVRERFTIRLHLSMAYVALSVDSSFLGEHNPVDPRGASDDLSR